MHRYTSGTLVVLLALAVSACSSTAPSQPSSDSAATGATAAAAPSVAGPLTASVTVPRPATPANNAQIANAAQPVTLVVQNAVVTSGAAIYTFEVATDSGFATKVQTKDGIAEGASGQTSVKLDTLPAAKDYFWHARAASDGTTGPFGATFKFTVGPAISISTPSLVSPANGASTLTQVTLTVGNATRVGSVGAMLYRFDISTFPGFPTLVATGTVAEGNGQTSFTTPALTLNTTYFWRVTAIDSASGITSAASPVWNFVTSTPIDLTKVIVSYAGAPSGSEVASWRQTGTITKVEQDGNVNGDGPICIEFTTTETWPSIGYFEDPSVPIYANQWYFANINGQWYGGPAEYLRSDRPSFCKTGQATDHIGPDGSWTGPMANWAPRPGELVGFMMSTPARAGMRSNNQRSNIVVKPWVDTGAASLIRTQGTK